MGGWHSLDGLEMEMESVMPTNTTTLSYGQSDDYTEPPRIENKEAINTILGTYSTSIITLVFTKIW